MFEQQKVNQTTQGTKVPSQKEFAETLAAVNQLYTAMKGGVWGAGTDENSIFKALENKTPDQIASIKAIYKDRTGSELEQDLKSELGSSDLAKVTKLLAGTSSSPAVNATNINPDEGLPSDYQEKIQSALKANNSARADALRLQYAMDGLGTDEDKIKQVLGNKTNVQIDALSTEYTNITSGRNIQNDLNSELGGRDQFYTSEALKGLPTTAAESVDRANREQAFERSNSFSTTVMDAFSSRGAISEKQNARLNNVYQQSKADGVIDEAETQRIKELSAYASAEVKDYAQAKDTVTEGVAAAGATAAAAGAIVLTAGLATPVVAGAAAAGLGGSAISLTGIASAGFAGAAGYTTTKVGMQGASYDGEGFVGDLSVGGVDGVLTALTGGANQAIKGGFAVQGAAAGGGGGITRQAVNKRTWENGAVDGLIKVGEAGIAGAAGGAVGGSLITGAKTVGKKLGQISNEVKVGNNSPTKVNEQTGAGEIAAKETPDNISSNTESTTTKTTAPGSNNPQSTTKTPASSEPTTQLAEGASTIPTLEEAKQIVKEIFGNQNDHPDSVSFYLVETAPEGSTLPIPPKNTPQPRAATELEKRAQIQKEYEARLRANEKPSSSSTGGQDPDTSETVLELARRSEIEQALRKDLNSPAPSKPIKQLERESARRKHLKEEQEARIKSEEEKTLQEKRTYMEQELYRQQNFFPPRRGRCR